MAASACNLRLIGGARDTARKQWDALARRGTHRHAWFVAAEACGAEPRHVGVFKGGKLVAVIPAYVEHETLHGDLHAHCARTPAECCLPSSVKKFGARLATRPVLVMYEPR
jgi:hypothetical protein